MKLDNFLKGTTFFLMLVLFGCASTPTVQIGEPLPNGDWVVEFVNFTQPQLADDEVFITTAAALYARKIGCEYFMLNPNYLMKYDDKRIYMCLEGSDFQKAHGNTYGIHTESYLQLHNK